MPKKSEPDRRSDPITPEEVQEGLDLLGPVFEVSPTTVEFFAKKDGTFAEKQKPGWIKFHQLFRQYLSVMRGSKLTVFIALALHIDDRNQCYPSIETLASMTGYSKREVINAVSELEDMGLVSVNRKHRQANIYHLKAFVSRGKGNDPTIPASLGALSSPKNIAPVPNC